MFKKISILIILGFIAIGITNVTLAQSPNYSGIYSDSTSGLSLELFQESDGYVYGTLTSPNGQLDIDGFIETDGLLYGEVFSDTEIFAVLAELVQSQLTLVIVEYDQLGNLNQASAQAFNFVRVGAASSPTVTLPTPQQPDSPQQPPTPTPSGTNPLAQPTQPVQQPTTTNPLGTPTTTPNPLGTPTAANPLTAAPTIQNPLGSPTQATPTHTVSTQALVTQLSGEDAQMQRQYQGGTRIKSTGAGVSFLVPQDYVAGFLPQALNFQIASMTLPGTMVVQAYSTGDLALQMSEFEQGFEDGGIQFIPHGSPQYLGDTLTMTYIFNAQGQQGFLSVLAKQSSAGNIFLLTTSGANSEKDRLETLAREVMSSVEFATPDATKLAQIQQQLAGQAFRKINSNSVAADSVTGIGGGSSSELTFDMCSNGQYNYLFRSDFSMGGPGSSVISQDGDSDQGTWQAGHTLLNPSVILKSVKGGLSHVEVFFFQGKTYVNQSEVYLVPSENCN